MEILRLAPSPTNQNEDTNNRGAHIGTVRTALYNFAIAKQTGGKLLMRIEDTDQNRSNDKCTECLVRDFELCGISFDAGFVKDSTGNIVEFNNTDIPIDTLKQSNRKARHDAYTEELLKKNLAYEKDGAVYFKSPTKNIVFQDEILGEIRFNKEEIQDFVIRKSSGIASFYAACTYDDCDMQVTHVVRGTEHVNTTPRQVSIQEALGFNKPRYSHIPLIMNPDGQKMSKRQTTGQVNLWDFVKDGYHVDAIINYISLLGWSPGKNLEFFSQDFFIKNFDIKKVVKTNARFDYKKLDKFNEKYLSQMTPEVFERIIEKWKDITQTHIDNGLKRVITKIYKGRAKNIKHCVMSTKEILAKLDENLLIVMQLIKQNEEMLSKLRELANCLLNTEWSNQTIGQVISELASKYSKPAEMYRILSKTFMGDISGPSLVDLIEELGKDKTISTLYSLKI